MANWKLLKIISILVLLSVPAAAGDLYRVTVQNKSEADRLRSLAVETILRVNDGYLVLADGFDLLSSGLSYQLLSSNVNRDELYLDNRQDAGQSAEIYRPVPGR